MSDKEPMTEQGYQRIASELEHLKNVERGAVAKEIETAKEHGDLRENAEYHAAKEKQDHMEKRIAVLQDFVGKAHVIDPSTLPHDRVSFGSTVRLLDLESDSEVEYTIVGAVESNVDKGYISYNSPLAKRMLGKQEGDDFIADLPNGTKEFEVMSVCYKAIEL